MAIEHLGAELPWEFVDSTFSRGRRPVLGWADWALRSGIYHVQFIIRCLEIVASIADMVLDAGGYANTKSRKKLV